MVDMDWQELCFNVRPARIWNVPWMEVVHSIATQDVVEVAVMYMKEGEGQPDYLKLTIVAYKKDDIVTETPTVENTKNGPADLWVCTVHFVVR